MGLRSAFASLSRRRHGGTEDQEAANLRDLPGTGFPVDELIRDGVNLANRLAENRRRGEAMRADRAAKERQG